jgi:calcineurin-like phosphoesterase family protein
VHDPDNLPISWSEWIIHGHKHNNDMAKYPFINGKNKTINVCAELLNYKPISLSYLLSLGLDSIKRMDTVDSLPERG